MLTDIIPSRLRSLAPRKSEDVFSDLQRSMNRVMRDFFDENLDFGAPLVSWSETASDFVPRLDIEETDDKILLSAELPGLSEKDVDVQFEKDYLTIKGEKSQEKSTKGNGRSFCERRYGAFERTIRMPVGVDKENISAKFDKGVLTVELPKVPGAKREVKKIAIKH